MFSGNYFPNKFVTIARKIHLYPSRTQTLSSLVPTIVKAKIGSCKFFFALKKSIKLFFYLYKITKFNYYKFFIYMINIFYNKIMFFIFIFRKKNKI